MHRQNSGSQRFLKNFAKRAQEVDQNYIVFFFQKKILAQSKQVISGLKILLCRISGSALTNFFKILNNERGQEIHQN